MATSMMSGLVNSLEGVLAKIDSSGKSSFIKQGATINLGDSLVLLDGLSQINLVNGLPIYLAVNVPYTLDGISPLKPDLSLLNQFATQAEKNNFDIIKFIENLDPATFGPEHVLGSGGSAFIIDPMFSSGLVTAGFDTTGPSRLDKGEELFTVQLYGNTKPEALLTLTNNVLGVDESLTVRNGDFNAADQVGVSDPFNYGTVIGYTQGFVVSSASSRFNQPASMVTSSYSLELGTQQSTLHTSDGSKITLSLENHRIVGKSGSDVIFAVGVDSSTGKITVVQYHGMYHPDPTSADESINLKGLIKLTLTLTDKSGDVSTATIDIGSKIHFEDDAPSINSIDKMLLNDNPLLNTPLIGTIDVDFNTDLAKDLVFNNNVIQILQNYGLSSNGQSLVYDLDSNSHLLTARTANSGQVIFTLQLYEVTPNVEQIHKPYYTLTIFDSIDQHLGDEINLAIPIKAIDADNDSVIGTIEIVIGDGADATGGFSTGFIAIEGDLDGTANNYPVTTHHQFTITAGVDRLVTESLIIENSTLNALINELHNEVTANGSPLTLTQTTHNGIITLTATDSQNNPIFQMTITPHNVGKDLQVDVTLIQYKPLDHQIGGDNTGLVRQDGSSLHIDLTLQAKDSDGDPLQNPVNLNVTINDGDAPGLGSHQLTFTENLTVQTQSGQVPLNLGSDTIASIVFENTAVMQQSLSSILSGGKHTSYSFQDNGTVLILKIDDPTSPINGQQLLKVTINTDGSYTAVLSGPLDQINNVSELILNVRATDKDADTSNLGTIKITINDAINQPYTTSASTNVTEGDLDPLTYPVVSLLADFTLQSSGDRLLPETVSFDPVTLGNLITELGQEIKVDGQPLVFTVNGTVITGSLNGNPIVVIELTATQNPDHYSVDASIKVTLNGPIDHNVSDNSGLVHLQGDQITIDVGVQVQDAEGDYLANPALIHVGISDGANPVLSTQNEIVLNEPIDATATGGQASFDINLGSDPIKQISFNYSQAENSGLKSDGHDVLFEIDNGILKGYYLDGSVRVEVLSAVLTNTSNSGVVSFELFKPLDHNQAGEDVLTLNLKIQAVDTDGDVADLTLPVKITDSIAHPADANSTVVEGQTVTGTLADYYHLNAEGGHLNSVTVNGVTYSFETQNTQVITTPKGEFTIHSDGTWQFNAVKNLDHDFVQELNVAYSVIDGDGDISPVKNLLINITDGAASSGGQTLSTSLTEGDMLPMTYPTHILSSGLTITNNGSDQFDLTTLTILNAASLTAEINQDLKFFNSTTGLEEHVVATVSNNSIIVHSTSGQLVLEIQLIPQLQANGDIVLKQDIQLYQPLSHLIANTSGNVQIANDQISIHYNVQVKDIDGDSLTNPVSVTAIINDGDNPDLNNTSATNLLDGANQTSGVLNLNIGSDPIASIHFDSMQPALNGLTSNGNPTTALINDHSIKIFDSSQNLLAEITLTDTGNYTIQLYGPLDQNSSNLLAIPLNVTATDRDGDSDSSTLTINIIDGTNPAGGNVVNLAVTEGSLSIANGYPVSNTQNTTIIAGSDRLLPQTINIDPASIASIISELTAEVKSGGQTITYSYDATTHVLTGAIGSTTVLTLSLNATQNGPNVDVSITFTQFKPLDHLASGNGTGNVTVNGNTISIKTPLQISDSDGDKLTSPISVTTTITDGALPIINAINLILVKESDISSSSTHIGSNSAANGETASGQIMVQEGSDKVARYDVDVNAYNSHTNGSYTANGLPISLVLTSSTATTTTYSGQTTGSTGTKTIFTLVLNNTTGSYTYTLLGAVDHPTGQGKNYLIMNFSVIAKDADGDSSAAGILPISIEDDVPSAVDVTFAQITEGQTTATVDLIRPFQEGADTGKIISVVDGSTTYTLTGTGYNSFSIYDSNNQELGKLFIRADGSTYFQSNANINFAGLVLHKELTFNVRDFDGDTTNAKIILNIADTGTTVTIASAVGVEDVGRDANEIIINPVTPTVGIPIAIQINIGDFDNGESVGKVLIRVPTTEHGNFYYNGAVLNTVVEGGISYYVIPVTAFNTTDNINYTLNGVTFIPAADYSTTSDLAFPVKVTINTNSGPKADVTSTLNINIQAIADTPTWDMAHTTVHYNAIEDSANVSLQLKGQLQDLDGSETIDYYLIKINAQQGTLIGTGLTQEGEYWKVSANNINTVQVDPVNDFSGIITIEAIAVSKEASNYVPGQQYAQSAPIILTIDVAPDADPIKLNISKPYVVSNEDVLINLNTIISVNKFTDFDTSENTFVRISQIPTGAQLILHGIALDVSGITTPGVYTQSVTYTDGTGTHTVSYQYYKDATNSANDYYQVNTTQLSALELKPAHESNVDFTLKVVGVVIDSALLSSGVATGTLTTDTKLTPAQFIDVNLKGVADMPVFDVTGTAWSLIPTGVETTILEDGQARLSFDVLSGEKALTPTDTSETLTMVISGIPVGAELQDSDGNTLTLTYIGLDSAGQPKYEVNIASLNDLILIPPKNSTADITLNAHLVVTENDGNSLIVDKQIVIHITPVIDAGDYSKNSTGLEDYPVDVNWMPPTFTDSAEVITGLTFDNIPAGGRLLINDEFITPIGATSVTLTAAQLNQLLHPEPGTLGLQYVGPENSDVDVNLNATVTVSQTDVNGGTVDKNITGSLHLNIQAVVEDEANLQVQDTHGALITTITSYNNTTIDLSNGPNSQGHISFQDLDPSSVETIQTMVISGLGSQYTVVGGVYDGIGHWIIPASGLDNLQIISKQGYNGSVNVTIYAQVQDLGDNNEHDVSALETRQLNFQLNFTGDGTGVGGPGSPGGVITIDPTVIIGQEDVHVPFSTQLASMVSVTGGTSTDVYALTIATLPPGFTLTGSGVIYDFVTGYYVITAHPDNAGGLILGQVDLVTPKDYSGSLDLAINWVANDTQSATPPVQVPLDIAPVVDLPPEATLQVVDPGGIAYEDTQIHLKLNVAVKDIDSETIDFVKLKVSVGQGQIVDSNNVPLVPDANGYVTVPLNSLNNINFIPKADYSGPVIISMQTGITDSAENHLGVTVTDSVTYNKDLTFNITPVNDQIIFDLPATVIQGNEDSGGVNFSGMTVTAGDTDGSEKIISLVIHGVPDDFLIGSAQNLGNGDWKITVNSSTFDLSNIKLISPENFSGTVDLQITAYTKENLATLPQAAGTQNFSITVAPVSDLVDIVGAGPSSDLTGIENTAITIALNVQARDDSNSYNGPNSNMTENPPEHLLVTISNVPEGATFELPVGVIGVISQIDAHTWTIEVQQSTLSNIIFLPNDANGQIELSIDVQAVDNTAAPGPGLTTPIVVNIDVAPVNDAPVNTVPTVVINANEDEPFVINDLKVTDIDAANGTISVTLAVLHGHLTIAGDTSGISFSGDMTNTLILTGTLSAINDVLAAGIVYQGDADYHGTDSLTMTTNDNGNTGSGGAGIDTDTVDIYVAPRSDLPGLDITHVSIIAALGALIPLQISAEVVNPINNELHVKLEGLSSSPVDSDGNPVGTFLGVDAWDIPASQLSNLYVNNLTLGTHDITVSAISDVNDGQPTASAPQTIQVTVLDPSTDNLEGGSGSDHIIGSNLDDVLVGLFGDDVLEGKDGNDLLMGGDGNDVLIGGKGNDTLTGGAGMDTFKWEINDHGTIGMPNVDIVTDFNPQEDKVDLSELLQGEHSGNYTNYLHVEYDAANNETILSISTQGNFNPATPEDVSAKTDQVIMLQGVDLVGAIPNQSDIINHLVALHQIVLDS